MSSDPLQLRHGYFALPATVGNVEAVSLQMDVPHLGELVVETRSHAVVVGLGVFGL
ncbi:hypothetical protein [Pseudoxanthomonas sp. CF125]|uniref:hypothetical protein n=1 Tax=Pseudoxanthomonas sp. CF125 TaxID=1855303 RepID=UPI00089009AB|nr:hypothetical protein [Pseudoxanthomonas sp. CF125]SDQ84697.1 hypothetical protein SAMN05216569_2284 [Pseudoxanthomonas sp. CF125]